MASSYFRELRNVESSTIKHLKTQIDASWTGITTIKAFYQAYAKDNTPPIVCIRVMDQNTDFLEIGATTLDNIYTMAIDIFATSDAQRMDIADFILDVIKDNWTCYTYAHTSGDKSTTVPTAAGKIRVIRFIENGKVEIGETEDSRDRNRHSLIFSVRKNV